MRAAVQLQCPHIHTHTVVPNWIFFCRCDGDPSQWHAPRCCVKTNRAATALQQLLISHSGNVFFCSAGAPQNSESPHVPGTMPVKAPDQPTLFSLTKLPEPALRSCIHRRAQRPDRERLVQVRAALAIDSLSTRYACRARVLGRTRLIPRIICGKESARTLQRSNSTLERAHGKPALLLSRPRFKAFVNRGEVRRDGPRRHGHPARHHKLRWIPSICQSCGICACQRNHSPPVLLLRRIYFRQQLKRHQVTCTTSLPL